MIRLDNMRWKSQLRLMGTPFTYLVTTSTVLDSNKEIHVYGKKHFYCLFFMGFNFKHVLLDLFFVMYGGVCYFLPLKVKMTPEMCFVVLLFPYAP